MNSTAALTWSLVEECGLQSAADEDQKALAP